MSDVVPWKLNISYTIGTLVSYNGVTYKCLQAHKSQDAWNPKTTATILWLPMSAPAPSPVPGPAVPSPSPSPVPAPTPPKFPVINEVAVSGIPSNTVFGMITVGGSLVLSGVNDVVINNPFCFSVIGVSPNFTVKCFKKGSTSVKMTTTSGAVRLYGLYTDLSPPSDRLLLGSVSEHDPQNGMRFWSEFECKNILDPMKVLQNKKCDLFYIYLNGGPGDYGWRQNYSTKEWNMEPEGKRAFNFLRNSLRLGGFTCFVWYNLPSSS